VLDLFEQISGKSSVERASLICYGEKQVLPLPSNDVAAFVMKTLAKIEAIAQWSKSPLIVDPSSSKQFLSIRVPRRQCRFGRWHKAMQLISSGAGLEKSY
jgi:hypothetical protein